MATVVYKLDDDISTDIIYPGRFMATVLPTETPQFAFADIAELNDKLKAKQIPTGSVIVAGKNFGCGSSREQAVSALKGYDLIIAARNFARIFLQNSINLGLQTVACPELEANVGDELEVTATEVVNKTSGKTFRVEPLPEARRAIVEAGGLIPYTRKRVLQRATELKESSKIS
ncbi:MAG: 3-isopropylmalate dehydratase [Ignavibacteriales bacterium]|nr:3-isopropylmalate dehydratase [Ignavibacteriales bacterium]